MGTNLADENQQKHLLPRKQPTRRYKTAFPKWRLRNKRRNFILMTCDYPDLGRAPDWLKQISHAARPIRSPTPSGWWRVISMEFLRSFLRRHFAGKPVVASRNIGSEPLYGCFRRNRTRRSPLVGLSLLVVLPHKCLICDYFVLAWKKDDLMENARQNRRMQVPMQRLTSPK